MDNKKINFNSINQLFNYENAKEKAEDNNYKEINAIVNDYGENRIELMRYKNAFKVKAKGSVGENIDKSPLFQKVIINNNDVLVPCRVGASLVKLNSNLEKSANRSRDLFYGYGYSNEWQYLFTITFAKSKVNRVNDQACRLAWSDTREMLQRIDKNVKILCAPERHEISKTLHFHALITFNNMLPIVDYTEEEKIKYALPTPKGDKRFFTYNEDGSFVYLPKTDYKYFLVPFYKFGQLQYSSSGQQLFCLNSYTLGMNTLAIIPDKIEDQLKVVNYCILYTTKNIDKMEIISRNKKRFYRTRNLKYKEKIVYNWIPGQFELYCKEHGLQLFKQYDKNKNEIYVLRNFNLRESTEEDKKSRRERIKR